MLRNLAISLPRLVLVACLTAGLAFSAAAQSLIRDTEIEAIMRDYTDPLLVAADLRPEDVQMFLINDPSLNAFVAHGQRVHLHTGLIIEAETPGQLKGVIAHEIGHIAGGHLVRSDAAIAIAQRPALISIGLGVLAIAAGAGDAGAALIASSQQFAMASFFTHTRAQEASADQAAVSYLTKTGQSTQGLVEFFENFRYQEVLSQARRFEYFRSHPLASDRIKSLRQRGQEAGHWDAVEDELAVHQLKIVHAKLIGFLEPIVRVHQLYPLTDTSEPARYARAIASMQAADISTALGEIDSLLTEFPNNPFYHELKGQILFESGRAAESVAPHQRSIELLEDAPLLLINYARSVIARGEEGDLEKGENALRDALIVEPGNAFAWQQLAIAYEKQGRRPEAELATAEAAYYIGDRARAYVFAERAMRELDRFTPNGRRASDIAAITDPRLEENRRYR
ncbi:MAG: M48 family metalloprotease [Hyphomonadaceae bacterium]